MKYRFEDDCPHIDEAMNIVENKIPGGIDFNGDMLNLDIKSNGEGMNVLNGVMGLPMI